MNIKKHKETIIAIIENIMVRTAKKEFMLILIEVMKELSDYFMDNIKSNSLNELKEILKRLENFVKEQEGID